jgi:hypothetical protein
MPARIIELAFGCDNRLYSIRNPLSCMPFVAFFCCIGFEISVPKPLPTCLFKEVSMQIAQAFLENVSVRDQEASLVLAACRSILP